MPFLFSHVCDLLQALDDNQRTKTGLKPTANIVQEWFTKHRSLLNRDDHNDTALLSTLFPEKRTDRIFRHGLGRLERIIGRGLALGRTRKEELGRHADAQWGMDLGECVERILRETPNPDPPIRPVTVEEIDSLFHDIASHCHFSSPAVRSSPPSSTPVTREKALGDIYTRFSPRDAKWFTRLFLKNYQPVILDQQLVYRNYHPRLPLMLKVRDDFVDAGRILASHKRERTVTGRDEFAKHLQPKLGVKVGRQHWIKGRSLQQCLQMGYGRMSCEEKYDGEYCQVHIDLSKGYDCIQIFSKSGKDSTRDRRALHEPIRQSLHLNKPSCPFKKGCILEGELLVYSDKEEKILDFYKIRKHVSRSGAFLSTEQDSQRNPWEHLMIVYYDILMVDDDSLLAVKHSERHQRLREIVTEVKGRSMLVQRQIIDCSRPSAESDLRRVFATCITNRGEGLVLKPDTTYFNFGATWGNSGSIAIKLKKEYIQQFGDVGDFAVVGACYDPTKAKSYGLPNIKWTHFYIACLGNKEEVLRFGEQPTFVVTNVVELNETHMRAFMMAIQPVAVDPKDNKAFSLRIEEGIDGRKSPTTIFRVPPVFDIRCFSFDRPGNVGFWTPRFPMVNKIHCDRTYLDVLSFSELQEMAVHGTQKPLDKESQELLEWIGRLEQAAPKTRGVEIQSQTTVSTSQAPSTPNRSSCPDPLPPSSLSSVGRDSFTPSASRAIAIRTPTKPKPRPSILPTIDESPKISTVELSTIARGEKRPHSSSIHPDDDVSKLRKHNDPEDQNDVSASRRQSIASSVGQREPLAALRTTSSRRNLNPTSSVPRLLGANTMYQPSTIGMEHRRSTTSRGRVSLPHSMSMGTGTSDFTIAIPQSTARLRISSSPTAVGSLAGNKCCRYLGDSCTFANISFMLSPCIAGYLWVTEDLLGCHGITEFARDAKEWAPAAEQQLTHSIGTPTTTLTTTPATATEATAIPTSSAPTLTGTPSCTPCGGIKRKMRIILVDPKRKEANKVFLQSVRDAGLRHRSGEPRHIRVYDWKVLEELKEEEERWGKNGECDESRLDMRRSGSIWRKYWVGLT
ncbi:ATP dependent DNA ligase [Pseudoneurospora amorphoporcata]|uniref:ATP dependent DNA ligase n=1 Tax=Pseudoneurospora amorphoporcata TaxID=241081 RepID=A0AAN6P0A4_9PEZI|nr:ATP dependent DNA ligase [Pseudoneurospora amorphoporcata]